MAEPVVYTSHSLDGTVFGLERPVSTGGSGQRNKRIIWWKNGFLRNFRVQKFRGTTPLTIIRLEVNIEALRS